MNSKLIVALIVVSVLAFVVVGIVASQAASTFAPNGTTSTASSGGFFWWIGRCLGFRATYNNATQVPAYVGQPENITVTNPNTSTSITYQGYYGYGQCGGMMGFRP